MQTQVQPFFIPRYDTPTVEFFHIHLATLLPQRNQNPGRVVLNRRAGRTLGAVLVHTKAPTGRLVHGVHGVSTSAALPDGVLLGN